MSDKMSQDENSAVVKMNEQTSVTESLLKMDLLESNVNNNAQQRKKVRVSRYWNEDYLIITQYNINQEFSDIYVWKWKECQNPTFLYRLEDQNKIGSIKSLTIKYLLESRSLMFFATNWGVGYVS